MGKIINFETEKLNRDIENSNDDVLVYATKKYLETKDKNDLAFLKLCIAKKRIVYEMTRRQCDDETFKSILQMGFILIEADYASEPYVKYYMAKYMVEEIMQYELFDIESKMHSKYKYKERFANAGITKIILDIIESYDYNLRDYVVVKNELLEPFKILMNNILVNWEKFVIKEDNNRVFNDISALVDEFISSNPEFSNMEDSLKYYLKREFKLDEKKPFFDTSGLIEDDEKFINKSDRQYEYELRHCDLSKQKKLYELKNAVNNYVLYNDKDISYDESSQKEKVKK